MDFPANVLSFSSGEICVSLEKSFRNVLVVTFASNHDEWMELFLLLDALRSAQKIILCLTYMGYSRQDRQRENQSFGAGLLARFLEMLRPAHCLMLDNHCEPMLRIPFHHMSAAKIFETDIRSSYKSDQIAVVSPDIGGAPRANLLAKSLGCDFAICNKTRNVFGELKKMHKLGGSVAGKICLLLDDIVDSGATLCRAAEILMESGALSVAAYCTHGVLSAGSREKLEKSALMEIVLTNSIAHPQLPAGKFRKLPITSLIAETIRCIL
jgi:ribose-phosphate pyrophosphokinase